MKRTIGDWDTKSLGRWTVVFDGRGDRLWRTCHNNNTQQQPQPQQQRVCVLLVLAYFKILLKPLLNRCVVGVFPGLGG